MARFASIAGLATLAAVAAAATAARAQDAKDAPPKPPLVVAAESAAAERAALAIPDALWKRVLDAAERPGGAIGFTSDEMKFYGGRDHLLRSVENMFRDARVLPRETGRITDAFIASGAKGRLDEVVQTALALTELPAGRMYAAPSGTSWGIEGVADGATAAEALERLKLPTGPEAEEISVEPTVPESLTALPEPCRRLIARLEIGARAAAPWFERGTKDARAAMRSILDDPNYERGAMDGLTGPWSDELENQSATAEGWVMRGLREHDRGPIAYGSVIFLAHLSAALAEYDAGPSVDPAALRSLKPTRFGHVQVFGGGDDTHVSTEKPSAPVVIDFGGNDVWRGSHGHAMPGLALAAVIDLAGDDRWEARAPAPGAAPETIACGVFGLGVVADRSGKDTYAVHANGLGRGLFGVGVLWDMAGDDTYTVQTKWGQGAAHCGAGVLLDTAGNDVYECAEQSQGLGSTLGCGLLLDLGGDDVYRCRDDGNVSALYLNQSVAMAQGCGYGRRADIGDGRSLAGGWGLLVDLAGNDRYHAQVWSQGAGYWWGVGVLEDRGGNDIYENGKYSSGAGAHYAIGVHVDVNGDDTYNEGVTTTKNQFQAHARDGSIGVFVDGAGSDRYSFRPNCAGSADLASVGLFWDRAGDDRYGFSPDPPPADGAAPNLDWPRPPFGTATVYRTQHRSFRDDQRSFGVFLDTGGRDTYPEGLAAKDGSVWTDRPWPNARGVGIDE